MRTRSSIGPAPRVAGLGAVLLLAHAGASGCAAPPARAEIAAELEDARTELAAGDPDELEARLNRVLAETKAQREEFASERFQAAELLARLHSALSLGPTSGETADAPSLRADPARPVPASARAGVLEPDPTGERGHLVTVIYHASQALGEARWTGQPADRELLRGIERLELQLALAYARLGFRAEAAEILARYPELAESRTLVAALSELELPSGLATWACEAFFELERTKDELEAYRFAVLALEGGERFGVELPATRARELEDWIAQGASVEFVCPESGTSFVPGQRRSPVSGIPQLDYVAVPRKD